MLMPCARRPRFENEIRLRFSSPATADAVALVLAEVRSRVHCAPHTRIALDCSEISELPVQTLAELARLRGELGEQGSDLVLVSCNETLRQMLSSAAFAGLLTDTASRHGAHALRGPHSMFLRTFRAGV
jgi:ABC-type transporter Mla MlaB component